MSQYADVDFSQTVYRNNAPPGLKSMLPPVIYAAAGIECNIYFDSAIDSATPWRYAYEVKCEKGAQGNHRWFWTPEPEDAGKAFDLEMRLFDDYGLVLSSRTRVEVAGEPADLNTDITQALLADSGVGCLYPDHLHRLMRENGFTNYNQIGSHSGNGDPVEPGGVAHDGYGGFAWKCFLERWMYSSEELPGVQDQAELEQMKSFKIIDMPKNQAYKLRSPLLKLENGKPVLDIPGWLQKINNGKAPDFIIIELGGNDMFFSSADTLEQDTAKVMDTAKRLLEELRKHAPDAVIGVTTSSSGFEQDGYGTNYGCFQSKYQFNKNINRYTRGLFELLKSMNDPKMNIIPCHVGRDPHNNGMRKDLPAHARSTVMVNRCVNALHCTLEGGYQWGDIYYCWMRKQLEK